MPKIFLKYFWAIQFLKLEKMVMKTLLFNTKTQVCPKIGTL